MNEPSRSNLHDNTHADTTDKKSDTKSDTSTPDSPCVGVCTNLFDESCRGCGRTIEEISHWIFFTDAEKQVVWQRIRALGFPKKSS